MSLRVAARRLAAPLGREVGVSKSIQAAGQSAVQRVRSFSWGQYFEEKFFWEKANVGPFFVLLFVTPTLYRSAKDAYWTRQLRKLDTEELVSDRFEWLRLNMLKDEVESGLLSQVPEGGVKPLELGPSSPP
eukprot:TRINITY_DN3424_c0_g3_i1.p1 TRINITY_DN3424_c0_g3~~TRINITY_DN3424_c0_g3_i1.p1  ORF type:complete len:131 (-),score=27.17 TRINITY_DN3424_c0_g3_i1:143-535(-)